MCMLFYFCGVSASFLKKSGENNYGQLISYKPKTPFTNPNPKNVL